MRLRLHRERCVGHGRCYVLAPDVFEEDERGHCVLERSEVPPEFADQARAGALNCPEGAIEIQEDERAGSGRGQPLSAT